MNVCMCVCGILGAECVIYKFTYTYILYTYRNSWYQCQLTLFVSLSFCPSTFLSLSLSLSLYLSASSLYLSHTHTNKYVCTHTHTHTHTSTNSPSFSLSLSVYKYSHDTFTNIWNCRDFQLHQNGQLLPHRARAAR